MAIKDKAQELLREIEAKGKVDVNEYCLGQALAEYCGRVNFEAGFDAGQKSKVYMWPRVSPNEIRGYEEESS